MCVNMYVGELDTARKQSAAGRAVSQSGLPVAPRRGDGPPTRILMWPEGAPDARSMALTRPTTAAANSGSGYRLNLSSTLNACNALYTIGQ